jgi:hypothetical protein
MPQTPSIHQLLSMLPESQIDHFIRQLSPEAVQALKQLETGTEPLKETVTTEIANAVWACLEAN